MYPGLRAPRLPGAIKLSVVNDLIALLNKSEMLWGTRCNRAATVRERHMNLINDDIYPSHFKMRFLTSHLASNFKRSSIEKARNRITIPALFLNQNV
jgi:hypothetical protein